jgi:uncharacterized membrane protein
MNFETNKILGCAGALLICLSVWGPTATFGFAILIGSILVLISIYGLAKFYKDKEIWNNTLYGTLTTIIGVIVTLTIIVASPLWSTLKNNIHRYIPDWNGNYATLATGIATKWFRILGDTMSRGGAGVVFIVVFWVFLSIAMFFMRRSIKKLAEHSHNDAFATTGTLLIIGAVIPILGLIGIWLSTAALAFALFTTKKPNPDAPLSTISSPSQTALTNTEINFCHNCGTPILPENAFCSHCGKTKREE